MNTTTIDLLLETQGINLAFRRGETILPPQRVVIAPARSARDESGVISDNAIVEYQLLGAAGLDIRPRDSIAWNNQQPNRDNLTVVSVDRSRIHTDGQVAATLQEAQ